MTLFRQQRFLEAFFENPRDWSDLENNVAAMTSSNTMDCIADGREMRQNTRGPAAPVNRRATPAPQRIRRHRSASPPGPVP
ncbi:hypothetical protein [Comamonas sp.]|uniref:hypothetical protein n=1 Tax=Comamonas sp. TaxID=34028 RepID=UPI00289CF582|nr:hypothetical protein [Comamonas sp.]